jgi:hypothetical protein
VSKRKAFEPGTTVPGGRPVLDKLGQQMFDRKGRPAWYHAKPLTTVLHFRNAAGKRRAVEKAKALGVAFAHVNELIPLAEPRDLTRVPLYRGFSARFANEVRAKIRAKRPLLWPRKTALDIAA